MSTIALYEELAFDSEVSATRNGLRAMKTKSRGAAGVWRGAADEDAGDAGMWRATARKLEADLAAIGT
jgi:hypothetical protein